MSDADQCGTIRPGGRVRNLRSPGSELGLRFYQLRIGHHGRPHHRALLLASFGTGSAYR
jgi:hypothetical protein